MASVEQPSRSWPKTPQEYYEYAMNQCANKKGVFIQLPQGSPMGDFAFANYSWTQEQQKAWDLNKVSPIKDITADVPQGTVFITQTYHGHALDRKEGGQAYISSDELQRIKDTPLAALSVWIDSKGEAYMIPREAMALDKM